VTVEPQAFQQKNAKTKCETFKGGAPPHLWKRG